MAAGSGPRKHTGGWHPGESGTSVEEISLLGLPLCFPFPELPRNREDIMRNARRVMSRGCRESLLLLGAVFAAAGAPRALAQMPPLGDEFQVNAYTTGSEVRPAVVLDSVNGAFTVGWQRPGADGPDIARRTFFANGSPSSSEVLVNTFTTADQTRARV